RGTLALSSRRGSSASISYLATMGPFTRSWWVGGDCTASGGPQRWKTQKCGSETPPRQPLDDMNAGLKPAAGSHLQHVIDRRARVVAAVEDVVDGLAEDHVRTAAAVQCVLALVGAAGQ